MPVLSYGGIPVTEVPLPDLTGLEDSRGLGFRRLDGTEVLEFGGEEFFALDGVTGLDMPPRNVVRDQLPGMAGTRLVEVQDLERVVFLPLWLSHRSQHRKYLERRDDLGRLLSHRGTDVVGNEGTFDLVAASIRGTRLLRCLYLDGWSGEMTTDEYGATWESVGLSLLACQPFWRGTPWSTPTIRVAAGALFLDVFPPQLGSSQALGSGIPLTVTGDVESWVTLNITGPATAVTVTGPGLSLSIPAGLASGEVARIVTNPRGRRALFNGVRDWSRVAPTDRYRPLDPGQQEISVVISGATSATSATVSGDSLYERAW